jgi:cytidine deaminase
VDTPNGGLCAERSAMARMITAGEYVVSTIVAVWRDANGALYVLPPCGICREFIRGISESNLETEVVLGRTKTGALRALLPSSDWPGPLSQ